MLWPAFLNWRTILRIYKIRGYLWIYLISVIFIDGVFCRYVGDTCNFERTDFLQIRSRYL
jgi:hypothetical protein